MQIAQYWNGDTWPGCFNGHNENITERAKGVAMATYERRAKKPATARYTIAYTIVPQTHAHLGNRWDDQTIDASKY